MRELVRVMGSCVCVYKVACSGIEPIGTERSGLDRTRTTPKIFQEKGHGNEMVVT